MDHSREYGLWEKWTGNEEMAAGIFFLGTDSGLDNSFRT